MKDLDKRFETREGQSGVPQFKYPSRVDLRIMSSLTHIDFPTDPITRGLPPLGMSEEQKRAAKNMANTILSSEEMIVKLAGELKRDEDDVTAMLKRIIE